MLVELKVMLTHEKSGDSLKNLLPINVDYIFLQTRTCDDKFSKASRTKRNTNSTSNRTTDWQSYLEFRVVTPYTDVKDAAVGKSFNLASSAPKAIYLFTVLISGFLSTLAVIAAVIACKAVRKNKCVQ